MKSEDDEANSPDVGTIARPAGMRRPRSLRCALLKRGSPLAPSPAARYKPLPIRHG